MLDFRIKTFITLCKILNYTKTAEALNITQPAVSQHIKYLELEYGVKLFEYMGRDLILTKEGKLLYNFALGIKNSMDRLKDKLSISENTYLPLNFGTTRTIGEFTMPKILSSLLLDFPTIKISMIVDNTEVLLNKLKNGEIDFALLEGQFNKDEFETETISKESFIGVCSPIHPFARNKVNFDNILEEEIIIREKGSGTREILEHIFLEHNITMGSFKKIIEIGNINAIKELVKDNLGITFLYKEAVRKELYEKSLSKIRIDDFDVIREFNFVFLKNSLHKDEFISWYNYIVSKNRA